MEFFLRSPDLSEDEIRRLAEAAKDLAGKAVNQHHKGLTEAVKHLEKILDSIGSELVAETGNPWGVAVHRVKNPDDVLIRDRVFLAEQEREGLGLTTLLIVVETKNVISKKETQESFFVGYETTGRAMVPDEDEDEESETPEMLYTDVITPLLCGEIV